MAKKLIPCKTCGAQIASNAKTCPNCGAKNKKKHPILFGILILLVLIIAIASSGNDDAKKVDSPTSSPNVEASSETDSAQTAFSVGETAELKDVQVTLVDASESAGSAYNTPAEGNVFVICEFEIANNSDEEINISSMMSFEAYCDDYACTYSIGALMEKENKNQLDGTVAPGKKFNGIIGYEIPTDWEKLEVIFTPDFWSEKDITFVVTND